MAEKRSRQLQVFMGQLDPAWNAVMACSGREVFLAATKIGQDFVQVHGPAAEAARAEPGRLFVQRIGHPLDQLVRYEDWRARLPPQFLLDEIPAGELPPRITGLQLALARRFLRLGPGALAAKLKLPSNGRRQVQRMEESDQIGGQIVAAVYRLGREALERPQADVPDDHDDRQPAAISDVPEEQRQLEAERVIKRMR